LVFDILITGEVYNQNDASGALHFRREAFVTAPNRLYAIGRPSPGVQGGFAVDPRDVAMESDPAVETHTYSISGTTTWEATENISLVNIANFRATNAFVQYDLDLSSRINGPNQAPTVPPGLYPNNGSSVIRRDTPAEQFSIEQQVKWASDHLNAVLGVFYFHEVQDPVDTVGFEPVLGQAQKLVALANPAQVVIIDNNPPVPGGIISVAHALLLCNSGEYLGKGTNATTPPPPKRVCIKTHLTNRSYSVFGQANLNLGALSDNLSAFAIKLGARFSRENVTAQTASLIFAGNGFGPLIMTTGARNFNARSFDNFSPEAGIEFAPTDDLLFYYTFSRGFKAGAGENNQGPGAANDFRSIIVDPEIIENHEAGLKSAWLDNRLIVNLSGFTYELTGQQINKTIAGGPAGFATVFQNAASTGAKGVELEVSAAITDNFRVSGSANWLDSKYKDFRTTDPLNPQNITTLPPGPVAAACAAVLAAGDPPTTLPPACFPFGGVPDPTTPIGDIQLAGNPTRQSPKWSANFYAEYDIHGLNLFNDGSYLTPSINVLYKGDVFFTEFHRFVEGQEAYTVIDTNLRYTSGNGRITADLWVKNAANKLIATSTFQLSTGRVIGVTYLPPRMFGFTLGYKF
jgi:iron complex outermembrane receptor protein